ncbi:MAG: hypothetical protein FWJ34_11485 [Geminocystis sp. GBBB08]|nr:hypothetical protein [Geminocystis sp. GBBB08]
MKSNQILNFCLLSTPIVLTSSLFNFWQLQPVKASESQEINLTIINPNSNEISDYPNLEKNEDGDFVLNFTDEESDSAIKMFGCDCPASLNKLKKLRGLTRGVYGEILNDQTMMATCPHQQYLGV